MDDEQLERLAKSLATARSLVRAAIRRLEDAEISLASVYGEITDEIDEREPEGVRLEDANDYPYPPSADQIVRGSKNG